MEKKRCLLSCLEKNKIRGHAERAARRVSASHLVAVLKSGEIPYQVRNDKLIFNGVRAFTLIELLVVVLIIGILAAVAVPQYTQAVEKSRFATYRTLADSIAQSTETYYLANGSWPTSLDELSVELPADMSTQNSIAGGQGVCRKNNKIFCCMTIHSADASGSIRCGDTGYHLVYSRWYASKDNTPSYGKSCAAKEEKYKAVCKAISGGKNGVSSAIPTPDSWQGGYFHYYID